MIATPLDRQNRLELIEVLRFIAAIAVVSFHWLHAGILNREVTTVRWSALEPYAFIAGGTVLDTIRRLGFTPIRVLGILSAVLTAVLFAWRQGAFGRGRNHRAGIRRTR